MMEHDGGMRTTVGIVQVRPGNLLSNGVAVRKLGSHSLLELAVRRMTDCQQLSAVMVVAGEGALCAPLAELSPPDVAVHASGRRTFLGRVVSAIDESQAAAAVLVHGDNPFLDPVLIDRLVTTAENHPECDYISYCSSNGRPVLQSPLGVVAEWCRGDSLRLAHQLATAHLDRESATRYIYSHPEKFRLRFIPAPAEMEGAGMRLYIDSDEAWERAQTMYDALGTEGLDWRRIAGMLDRSSDDRAGLAVAGDPTGH